MNEKQVNKKSGTSLFVRKEKDGSHIPHESTKKGYDN